MHIRYRSLLYPVWVVLSLVQRLLLEGKMATQREAYYCLVQNFKNQAEFNDTLQGQAMQFTALNIAIGNTHIR